jgi:hypothetical protein
MRSRRIAAPVVHVLSRPAKVLDNQPLERTAAAVYFTGGRLARVRRRGRSTALRYPALRRFRGIIILLIFVAAYIAAEWLAYRRTVPPRNVNDLVSFTAWRPHTREVEIIRQGETEYLLATAGGGALLPSGPSGYIFDRSGRLVDWSSDIGDDSRFQNKWTPSPRQFGEELDMDSAMKWINSEPTAG